MGDWNVFCELVQASTDLESRNAAVQRDLTALETKQQYVSDLLAESQKVLPAILHWSFSVARALSS